MINAIKRNITIRRGFITGVILLILVNIIFISGYYRLVLNNRINEKYQELTKELDLKLEELVTSLKNEENNLEEYLNDFSLNENVTVNIYNKKNELILNFSHQNEKSQKRNNIIVTKILSYKDDHYIITLSKKSNVVNMRIALNFLAFEIFNIIILALLGIFISNLKILSPITSLSKDLNNYKLGIIPNKRAIHGEIDILQNDFVDLVNNLEEEKQKQNRIIASISHDIKTPLTSILGYSERLSQNNNLSDKIKIKYATTIYNKSLVMKEIVEEFDDYLSCNIKDTKKTEKIYIKYLIDYLNKYYKDDLNDKNIDFKINTNCPNSVIEVDLAKFKRIFSNVITNSIRHFNSSKKILIININSQKDDKIVFEIADNGCGCEEDLLKIFEPLYTTDKSRKISGLGLSICKEIVESHNGTIYARNNKYGGFSVFFTIPEYKEN